jgi:hypothetical protein
LVADEYNLAFQKADLAIHLYLYSDDFPLLRNTWRDSDVLPQEPVEAEEHFFDGYAVTASESRVVEVWLL